MRDVVMATIFGTQFAITAITGDGGVRRKEVESAAAVGLCCTHSACAPMRCLPERKNLICDVFDSV